MPRARRKKSDECMYHVMTRSISEIDLFRCDEDKNYYLTLLKRYLEENHCRLFAYVLMDNHMHLYIDPCGFDISKFMQMLNTAYVRYYNRRYNRTGHLYGDRFASYIVHNERYSHTLSAYIHNNAKNLPGYGGREEEYPYSSYGIYTGRRKDLLGIVDTDFILQRFSKDKKRAEQKYRFFTQSMKDRGILKEIDDNIMGAYNDNDYCSEKQYVARTQDPDELVQTIGNILDERITENIRAKYNRECSKVRAFVTYTMRVLGGYTYSNICEYIGNMSMSGISRLSREGFKLLNEHALYRQAFNTLIQSG